ncbi:hypothetical protein OsI_21713 [Oryza sativa Indica Group]|uniref:Glycosyl transferase CAP10 domain-containing protein n=1 Tax=Oryza sativa subsp. indica TaxID=39946 RepID=B8B2Z0_ORYSI|nr:hypothetical protein OsI_21713 [Oryza sativa Indica Group]
MTHEPMSRSSSSFFRRDAAGDEETAALTPPPPPADDKGGAPARRRRWPSSVMRMKGVGSVMVGVVFLALLVLVHRWVGLDASFLRDSSMVSTSTRQWHPHHDISTPSAEDTAARRLRPTARQRRATCPATPPSPPPTSKPATGGEPAASCPDYFRYIHDDLRPWRGAGITREAVERGRRHAYFRLVVVSGRAYVETYRRSYQTRDAFTQWGVAQLLRRYAGRVPDVDIMFACDDRGRVRAADFAAAPADAPPVFRYCRDATTLDVVFPDWSFWGWPEVNIGAWPATLEAVRRESARVRWPEREPFAFWKGNPGVARIRGELMKCNPASDGKDWNARLFSQTYRRSYQTRDAFTQWGVAQLLRRYAGRVPDVDIMFACDDRGRVRAADFAAAPADAPPVFRYCRDATTLDVVFPDWSFWGWPEVNIGAWPATLEAVRRESARVRWPEREPFAFWKGNPGVARIRGELMKCNPASDGKDWNARLFSQDWNHAIHNGFKDSSIPKQCLHRAMFDHSSN